MLFSSLVVVLVGQAAVGGSSKVFESNYMSDRYSNIEHFCAFKSKKIELKMGFFF